MNKFKINKFKIGDKVRCVDNTHDMENYLQNNKIYTITGTDKVSIQINGRNWWYVYARFKLAEKEAKEKSYYIDVSNLSNIIKRKINDFAEKLGYNSLPNYMIKKYEIRVIQLCNNTRSLFWWWKDINEIKQVDTQLSLDDFFNKNFEYPNKNKEKPIIINGAPVVFNTPYSTSIFINGKVISFDTILSLHSRLHLLKDTYREDVSITVGCETIPLSKIDKIVQRIKEIENTK